MLGHGWERLTSRETRPNRFPLGRCRGTASCRHRVQRLASLHCPLNAAAGLPPNAPAVHPVPTLTWPLGKASLDTASSLRCLPSLPQPPPPAWPHSLWALGSCPVPGTSPSPMGPPLASPAGRSTLKPAAGGQPGCHCASEGADAWVEPQRPVKGGRAPGSPPPSSPGRWNLVPSACWQVACSVGSWPPPSWGPQPGLGDHAWGGRCTAPGAKVTACHQWGATPSSGAPGLPGLRSHGRSPFGRPAGSSDPLSSRRQAPAFPRPSTNRHQALLAELDSGEQVRCVRMATSGHKAGCCRTERPEDRLWRRL